MADSGNADRIGEGAKIVAMADEDPNMLVPSSDEAVVTAVVLRIGSSTHGRRENCILRTRSRNEERRVYQRCPNLPRVSYL